VFRRKVVRASGPTHDRQTAVIWPGVEMRLALRCRRLGHGKS
jgi:hypothetical protein